MTDDERQRLMDFILEQQAATGVKLDQLSDSHKQLLDSHRRDSIRLDRDERLLTLMIGGAGGHVATYWKLDKSLGRTPKISTP